MPIGSGHGENIIPKKVDVLVIRGAADVEDSCQFGHIELSSLVAAIVAAGREDVLFTHLRTPNLRFICVCIVGMGLDGIRPAALSKRQFIKKA